MQSGWVFNIWKPVTPTYFSLYICISRIFFLRRIEPDFLNSGPWHIVKTGKTHIVIIVSMQKLIHCFKCLDTNTPLLLDFFQLNWSKATQQNYIYIGIIIDTTCMLNCSYILGYILCKKCKVSSNFLFPATIE